MTVRQRVLVAGAGDVGLALAARLVPHADVWTLNRSGRSVAGATPIAADLADPVLGPALPEVDVVVFTTAPPTPDEAGYRLAYLDGPARVLDALERHGLSPRCVLTSTTGVYGVDDGGRVDHATPAEPTRPTARIVVEGERALAARVPTVLVRAAGIYGPGRGRLVRRVRAGEVGVTPGSAPRWTNRIHRDDLVAALHLAVRGTTPPVVVAVDDEPAPRDEVVAFLAERLGVALGPDPDPADRPRGKRCRNDALRAAGWQPAYPTYREGYPPLLASL